MIEIYIIYILHSLLGCGIYFLKSYYQDSGFRFDKKAVAARFGLAATAGYIFALLGLPDSLTSVAFGYMAPSVLSGVLDREQGEIEDDLGVEIEDIEGE